MEIAQNVLLALKYPGYANNNMYLTIESMESFIYIITLCNSVLTYFILVHFQ